MIILPPPKTKSAYESNDGNHPGITIRLIILESLIGSRMAADIKPENQSEKISSYEMDYLPFSNLFLERSLITVFHEASAPF
ncbi:MAG: hypothetical protein A2Z14_13445 [Chloroflexi bacterium RBG_16_48_8]|nr:MAG: hypothetical protein A2Z14_13445 [Chloroflexi bacterium RBG_16_48_8]